MRWRPISEFNTSDYKTGEKFLLFDNFQFSEVHEISGGALYLPCWGNADLNYWKYFLKLEQPTGENE